MRNRLFVTLVLLIFISCNTSKKDERLLGEWHSMNYSDTNELRFYQDSIILYEMGRKFFGDWNSKNSNINVTLLNPDTKLIIDEFEIEYKFNKDSSLVINASDTISEYPLLINVKNRFQHLQKMLDLKIDLPHSENSLESSGEGRFNQEIYIGFKDGVLKAKVGDKFVVLDKKTVRKVVFYFRAEHAENDLEHLKYIIVADKNTPEYRLDTLKTNLRNIGVKNILRVYKNDSVDYQNINWYGDNIWYGLLE